jgi:hypothetical protein
LNDLKQQKGPAIILAGPFMLNNTGFAGSMMGLCELRIKYGLDDFISI